MLYRYNAQGDLDTLRACFGKADNWQAGLVMPPCRAFRFTWDSPRLAQDDHLPQQRRGDVHV
ncbi:MAG: hypothetical protein IPL76_00160 [Gemmatimonadetes bacterium]|nr:hypothetical protein [Gemmatimonadota bacterium]